MPKRLWMMPRSTEHHWTHYDAKLRRLVRLLNWDDLFPERRS